MNGSLQLIGFLLAVVGGLCTLSATFLPEWKRNDQQGNVLEVMVRHYGIWIKCVSYPTGQWQCDDYDAVIIGLPQDISVARWTSVVANLFGAAAYLMSFIGLDCTKCVESNPSLKRRIALICSACWIMCGIMMGVAASFFSHGIVTDYSRISSLGDDFSSSRYIFGPALFIGWTAMVLCIIGGLIMGCGSFSDKSQVTQYQRASVRQVGRLGRSITQSFRRGRDEVPLRKKREDADYV